MGWRDRAHRKRTKKTREAFRAGNVSFEDAIRRITGVKSMQFQVVATLDGWVPQFQFTGNVLDQIIAASSWAFACMTANARAASELPGIVQTRDSDGKWKRDMDHPLNSLIAAPFGNTPRWPRWNWKQFIQTIALQLPSAGNAYLKPSVTEGGRTVSALFLLMHPGAVSAIEGSDGLLDGWTVSGDDNSPYELEDLVNIQDVSASSLWDGISSLAVAEDAIQTDSVAGARQRANMENKVSPGLVIVINDDWGMGATQEQKDQILQELADNYEGATNDGKPFVIGGGAELKEPPTSTDLQVFDTRKFARDEMIAIFGTPPPMIGIYESATLQNFRTAFEAWWMSRLFPMNHAIYSSINAQAIQPVYGPDVRLWYDLANTDIGLSMMSSRLDVAAKIKGLGHTANTASAQAGLDLPYVEELEVYNTDLALAGRDDPAAEGTETDDPAAAE